MNALPADSTTKTARILVVDDTEANRDLLLRRLQREGHQTASANDGQQALDLMQAQAFDLVLLDLMMPVMDGFELLQRMKADRQLQHLPVILISALDDRDSVLRGIAMGADDHLPKPFDRRILMARVNACLARKRLRDLEQQHTRQLERELDIAREIQAGFLPRNLPEASGWELAAWFEPARQVGGDFYDAFPLRDRRHLVLAVADVCDKGVGAALFMALFRSLLRAQAEQIDPAAGNLADQLVARVSAVNGYIARTHGEANMFATMFVALLDTTSGDLLYVNGGHEQPVIAASGRPALRELPPTGPAVGMLPDLAFAAGRDVLVAGESLVLFTDGITDARNRAGEAFGRARLCALVTVGQRTSAGAVVAAIRQAVGAFDEDAPRFDDVTLLVVQRQPMTAGTEG